MLVGVGSRAVWTDTATEARGARADQLSQRHQGGLPLPEGEHERVPDPRLTARGLEKMT